MKLTTLMLFLFFMQVSAHTLGQKVTLSERNSSLTKIFEEIRNQTGYDFAYTTKTIQNAKPVSIEVHNMDLTDVLKTIFEGQPLDFRIENKSVVVSKKELNLVEKIVKFLTLPMHLEGVVTGEGLPLPGVTITNKRTGKGTVTNTKGEFNLDDLEESDLVVFSCIGYEKFELLVKGVKSTHITVAMKVSTSKLDEVQVVAYGQNTSQRLTTGAIARVSADDIAKQPVSNVLQALSGQVPGLLITQASGTPGAGVSVQIRAAGSLKTVGGAAAVGSNPLYIIDGVPFLSEPAYSAGGNTVGFLKPSFGNSPMNAINPTDIESIAVLKDADATSIYGSRGANGVILITTKKGKAGKTKVDFTVSTGISDVANLHRVQDMTLDQYLEVRKRAFANSNVAPTTTTAPDLLVWDQSNGTDFQKELMGKTANASDFSASFSGGNESTHFLLSGNYHHETTVIPGGFSYQKGSTHFAAEHNSLDRKFSVSINATLVLDKNNNVARQNLAGDLGQAAFTQAPNFPLYNSAGELYWYNLGVFNLAFNNPLSYTKQKYTARNNNLIGGVLLKYTPVDGLNIKLNTSYNRLVADAQNLSYSQTFNPLSGNLPSAALQQNTAETWNLEPQIDYSLKLGQGNLNVLTGATFQDNKYNQPFYIIGNDYSSDALLGSISNASSYTVWNYNSEYKYQSVFGRINYNWKSKYLINVNYRYDGSSKFGENKRFGTFGSIGAAWVLSEESFMKNNLPIVSFAKLRSSYGTAGNDQIPNYLYFDTYQTTFYGYGGTKGLVPSKLANPNLEWELTKKFEAALDLGFLKDRILISGAFFRNTTDNSLVSNPLSIVAGFSSYFGNLPAKKQQQGFEFTLATQNIKSRNFSWTTNFNISFAQSKLVDFPNIANTGYANLMMVGESLSTIYGYRYTGISPTNNLPTYLDANGNGNVSIFETGLASTGTGDYVALGKTDPDFFGGMSNSVRYKNFQLDMLWQFTGKSTKYGIEYFTGNAAPGYNAVNMSSYSYDLFQATNGAIATRTPSAGTNNTAYDSYYKYFNSSAVLSNGAYLRLKNVALSYSLENRFIKRLKLSSARIFLQGQNLLTFTNFKGYDPETPASNIPPLRTIITGINLSF